MPNGQPTSSWSATAFSRVFGESAARQRPVLARPCALSRIFSRRNRPGTRCGTLEDYASHSEHPVQDKERTTTFFTKAKEKNSTDIAPRTRTRPLYRRVTMIFRFLFHS